MSRPRAPAHPGPSGLALAALVGTVGCGLAGLPDSVRPRGLDGRVWPDVAAPVEVHLDGRRDAALILSVEDYRELPDRPRAHEMAGAWYRYLHERRGLRARRIVWLRDGEVTPGAARDALLRAHWAVATDATLWIVLVGHVGSGPTLEHGVLLGATSRGTGDPGEDLRIVDLLMRGGHGYHRETVAVVDGCLPAALVGAGPLRSGAPARSLPSLRGWHDRPQTQVTIAAFGGGEAITHDLVLRREPTDLAAFTAGVGEHCVEALPGDGVPALSYLLLGALRGWADADGDGRVIASEALRSVDRLLRGGGAPGGRVEARGADIVLARGVRERGPEVPAAARTEEEEAAAAVAFADDRMIKIDRGAFTLGCRSRREPQCERDEFPARRIHVDSFAIDRYEVTWQEYAGCVAAGACSKVARARCNAWTGESFALGAEIPAAFLGPEQPVVCATWTQAAEFCAWAGKRLPTEAEWERAARGGSARRFPWGDEPPTCERAQTYECGYVTAPVGSHPAGASPEGVHDLAGNVAEWVHDWYGKRSYRYLGRHNPTGFDRGEVRVVRGGSFYDGHGSLRASYRYGLSPQFGYGTVGFRCAR